MGPELAAARRLSLWAGLAAIALVAGGLILLSLVAKAAVPWAVGALLASAVVWVAVMGFHAGGHAWFVPAPVLVLAGTWALTASAGNWSSPLAWTMAALTLVGAAVGAVLVLPALALRHRNSPSAVGAPALLGATGTALTALAPQGVARVNNETWTAESLSGDLPAGAPVHVAKVEGVRLLVWSEAGAVPGPEALRPEALRGKFSPGAVGPARPTQEKEEP